MTTGNDSLRFDLSLDTSDFTSSINDADRLARGFSRSLASAFTGVASKGKTLGDVVDTIGLSLSKLAVDLAFKPIEQGLGQLLSPLTQGVSNLFSSTAPQVTPFAKGGVVSAPTFFPMSGSLGMAGERGAEAILPLARGRDGSLGVRLDGQNNAPSVTINISTPDIDGFRRSQSEVAASVARMVARGQRSL